MPPKRRREAIDPIDIANLKTDEQFIADYLYPNWITTWTHPKTSTLYTLTFLQSTKLCPSDLQACFNLISETSKSDYEQAACRWNPDSKLKEMKSPELRYILIKDCSGTLKGFTSLMPTYECGEAVIYCYEIHLKPELRNTGLGCLLMGFLEKVARSIKSVEKVMLTCFLSNEGGLKFYKRLGFSRDEISPVERRLRGDKVIRPDYVILSKVVKGE
ncbi:acyl-CoA N-acyltransferase [Podospora fimiseda]|uniref:N-alpha-acetyltransferase 40 n=1 Tax=Podospora fimiseda TaxID=252190 RepID=A0AAN7BRB8_9PEZI|nr:acyl-CoA N-acyltransferase [Podospora fimiseda]